ncbi:FixL [Desulforapulum autotrophicum HRM2]|uniref:histidine kinase n=1 Tax=Desulforapulum autotrophicum (strain ATCC 43914 / DSM 3382 / VKM B-1955 / HRM2) TaxID=177437 RepID=C0QFK9_DESAH|nr:GAF domain-containing protein [Desulforapulum autotrophicum]ACN13405.1 FixL [Desulforapulum autotrophicum HRM2]
MTTKAYARDAGTTIDVLFEISDAVNRTFDLNELFDVIHKSLSRILNVDNFFIATHNEENDSIRFDYWVNEIDAPPGVITHFSNTSSITGEVINAKKPLIFYREDILNFAKAKKAPPIGSPCEIWLGAPLEIRGRVIGAISVQSFTSRTMYQPSDLDLLNSVSQHIALAIERKQSERAIKNQQIILEKILELSPVGITLVENQVFKWVNNEMVHLLGYNNKEDFTNKTFNMLFASRDEYDRVGTTIYNTLAEKGRASLDLDLIKKNGTVLHAHVQLSSADNTNPLAWIIVSINDISIRKQMETETIQHEKLQAVLEMAGAVCHELNQPLQAILGYSELIMMDQEPDSQLFRDLGIIRSQTARIGTITKKLSEITKYKTVDYPGQTKIVDIWGSATTLE